MNTSAPKDFSDPFTEGGSGGSRVMPRVADSGTTVRETIDASGKVIDSKTLDLATGAVTDTHPFWQNADGTPNLLLIGGGAGAVILVVMFMASKK